MQSKVYMSIVFMLKIIGKMQKKNHRKSAFSLIEMSVVLVIIAIIISGMLTISTVAITNEKAKVTKDRIDEIYKALGRFMLKNYRLPCPASLISTKNTAGYGAELGAQGVCGGSGVYTSATLASAPIYGAVPVNALGLADEFAEDAFGSKFAYVVYKYHTLAEYPAATSVGGFSYQDVNVSTMMPNVISMPSAAATYSAFVIISFGANKYGAFNANSATQNSGSGASTYELQNMLANISGSVADFGVNSSNLSKVTFTIADTDSAGFDDIVFFKKREDMIADFDSMFLKPCFSPGAGYADAYYGKSQYRATACPMPNDNIIPSVECAAFGTSVTKQSCP